MGFTGAARAPNSHSELVSLSTVPSGDLPAVREIRVGDLSLLVADPQMARLYELIEHRLARSEILSTREKRRLG